MKSQKNSQRINMFFSAFLIIAYVICAYFFSTFAATMKAPLNGIVTTLIFVVFGLLVFYATRVGEGKPVKRFSLITFIVLDLPCLYVLIAYFAEGLPFHNEIVSASAVFFLAAVALGYALPYTFLSGFEMILEDEAFGIEADSEDNTKIEEKSDEIVEQAKLSDTADKDVLAQQDLLDKKDDEDYDNDADDEEEAEADDETAD